MVNDYPMHEVIFVGQHEHFGAQLHFVGGGQYAVFPNNGLYFVFKVDLPFQSHGAF
jgi:hypothetical protein